MRETLEALSSLGFSVGQPEMVPQSEPREGSHNVQEQMSSSREERVLGVCSGHKAPTPEEGARTEQAEAPCRGQACTAQKAQPVGACPVSRGPCHETAWGEHGGLGSCPKIWPPRDPCFLPAVSVSAQDTQLGPPRTEMQRTLAGNS
uniref:Zinc finger protein 467 n=1 Tax=Mandrillus leucophaeus TaxID=9568 RepID=A0A2K5ZFA7_MANLE